MKFATPRSIKNISLQLFNKQDERLLVLYNYLINICNFGDDRYHKLETKYHDLYHFLSTLNEVILWCKIFKIMKHSDCILTTPNDIEQVDLELFQFRTTVAIQVLTSLIWAATLLRACVYTRLNFIVLLASLFLTS